jgi:CubicO group peptidase (beta-lactamase class C family)
MCRHAAAICLSTLILCWSSVHLSGQSDAERVRNVVRAKAPDFSGTVLVSKQGRTILHEGFGLANRQFDVPNSVTTKFRIASITKLFTSVIVLQLHDEGKVDLLKPIGNYLPACRGEVGSRVTLTQLLNHTSGLKDLVAIKSKEDAIRNGMDLYQRPYSVDAIAAKYCASPLERTPGAGFSYNNGDYILLGQLVEQVEQEPFGSVLTRRILRPLVMAESGPLNQGAIVPALASAYFTRDDASGALSNDLPVYDENWGAAGAMYSTTADLRTFAEALFGGRLLKPQTLQRLMQPGLDDYGFGAWIYRDDIGGRKYTTVMRPGQIMGTNTVLYRVVEAGLTIVLLSNTDKSNVDALAFEISKVLLGTSKAAKF